MPCYWLTDSVLDSVATCHCTGRIDICTGRNKTVMVEGSFHVYMELSLVTSELEKLCQQTRESIG